MDTTCSGLTQELTQADKLAASRSDLCCGDCLALMDFIPSGSVDMILCDLPYGTTQNKWDVLIPFGPLWAQYWRIAKPNAAIVLTAQTPFDKVLGASCVERLKYEFIWVKPYGTGFLNAKKAPIKSHENILVFYKKPPTYNPQMRLGFKPYEVKQGRKSTNYGAMDPGFVTRSNGERYPISVLNFGRETGLHPTQKPVALFRYLIETYTNPGMTVLDNCMGSGTTGVAAKQSGRHFIGFEKDPAYFETAKRRIADAAE